MLGVLGARCTHSLGRENMDKKTKYRKDLQAGDVVLDCVGREMFRVSRVDIARAKGYVVVQGEWIGLFALRPDGRTLAGHRMDVLGVA
jgi:hypothetical protein